jgi:hypothetical protein
MIAIESQCLMVTRLGQLRAPLLMINVAKMPDHVCQHERFANFAKQRNGFLIAAAGRGGIPATRGLAALPEFLRMSQAVQSIRVGHDVAPKPEDSIKGSWQVLVNAATGQVRSQYGPVR